MKTIFQFFLVVLTTVYSFSQEKEKSQILCASDESPYRDFDFVLGEWDFLTSDGKKMGEQIYTKQEKGCAILEKWTTLSGSTGTGMTFVDPNTGLWRQVWMSPMFHIDYSGSLNETGAMVLEGTMYPNNGKKSAPVRGLWAKQGDGTIKQEFLKYNEQTKKWESFFSGVAHPKTNNND
ncbi:hypothetical protein [Aquimarina pacifica]|uniref:hypothetical protein n=1 Tax=Aquimarina pacifica TaxID=1296415 RepID=UPI00046F5797|nr:hypothetical protein [Aquimarina pacifica]